MVVFEWRMGWFWGSDGGILNEGERQGNSEKKRVGISGHMRKTNRESARIHRSGKSCRRPGGSHERNALYLVIYQKNLLKNISQNEREELLLRATGAATGFARTAPMRDEQDSGAGLRE